MRVIGYSIVLLLVFVNRLAAQVKIGHDPSVVNSNAVLHLEIDPAAPAGAGKGLLLPVLTDVQLPAVSSSIKGMIIYNSSQNCLQICDGTAWKKILGSTSKTKQYSLSAMSFNTEGTYTRSNLGGGIYIGDGLTGTQGNLYAGVNLPDGAVVTAVDAYVLDNDGVAGRDVSYVQLWRQDGAVGSSFGNALLMAQTTGTSNASAVIQKISDASITSATIDNTNYTYYIRVGSFQNAPNIILYKVVISYTITTTD